MYNSYISLGWFCGVAASLKKNGLRSFSGPFDWYYSDFDGVLKTIESDFSDYLIEDNLRIAENNPKEFEDVKYGFYYNHEVLKDYNIEIDQIRDKYSRRIQRFKTEIEKGNVCFIRAVRSEKELDFICTRKEYIYDVLKLYNNTNSIIYLIPEYMSIPDHFSEEYYVLSISRYHGIGQEILRNMFDANDDLIPELRINYNLDEYRSNILFDSYSELKRVYNDAIRYANLDIILNTDYSKISSNETIDIYGLGNIGKLFYQKVKQRLSIGCFIDASSKLKEYEGVPVFGLNDYQYFQGTWILVTPTYDYYKICIEMRDKCSVPISKILVLADFLKENERFQ